MNPRLHFRALAARWSVEGSPWWLDRLATVFAATAVIEPDPEDSPTFRIVGDGPSSLFVGEERVLSDVAVVHVLDRIVWEVNQLAWRTDTERVLVHGAAVEIDGRGVLISGPSGAGKTTLAAALCVRGAGYLSDEIAALGDGLVHPYPKPLSLRPGAAAHFDVLAPPADLAELMTNSWYVPIAAADAVPVGAVVFVDHDSSGSTVMRVVPRADALVRLCDQTPNLRTSGAVAFSALAATVRATKPVELVATDLGLACDLVGDLIRENQT